VLCVCVCVCMINETDKREIFAGGTYCHLWSFLLYFVSPRFCQRNGSLSFFIHTPFSLSLSLSLSLYSLYFFLNVCYWVECV
jgi:hypothetical protein